jgi:hypothetical protein
MPYDQSLEAILRAFEAQVQATPGILTSDKAKDMLGHLGEKISTGPSSPDRVRALEAIKAAVAYLEATNPPPITPRSLVMMVSVLRYDKTWTSESFRLQLQVNALASEDLKKCAEFEATVHSLEEKQQFYSARLDSIRDKVKDAVAKGQMTQKHAKNIFAAIEFYRANVHIQSWQSGPSSTIGEILAIDFTRHVALVTCHTSSTLYQLQKSDHSVEGAFYTAKPPVTVFGRAAVSGISAGAVCDTGHDARHTATETHDASKAGVKSVYASKCECPVLGLSSRAAPTVDTWSSPGQESPVAGGGSQIRIADDARPHVKRTSILTVDRWGRPLERPQMVSSKSTADQLAAPPEAALPSWLQSAPSPPKVPTRQPVTPMSPHAQALLDALTPGSTPSRPVSARRRKSLNNGLGM